MMVGQVHDLLTPRFQPMLIPPLPWRSPDSGGHLIVRHSITRSHKFQEDHWQQKALLIAQERSPDGVSRVCPIIPPIIADPASLITQKLWTLKYYSSLPYCP